MLFLLLGSVYTVEEGHVGIVKRWSKAVDQVGPGLHVKIPIADSIERIEVRQRKNVEDLAAATKNQLPTTATVSINWTVNRNSAMDLFIHYGGLDQFETRILDPKLRSAAKAAIARFQADELIRNRQAAVAAIMEGMALELEGFPVTVNSPQIENLSLPNAYLQAVEEKEKAREDAEKEKHKLDQQRLIAQQAVNSAEANAEAKRLEADAEAYRVLTEAQAEADAIRLINEQLGRSPLYVDLVRAKRWDGVLPQTVLGEGVGAFLSLPPPQGTTSADDTK
ncbi:MAG: prohibitin family protein [Boseongicola sp. SB0675_bin_26]|nr:prohibitin family protein [Boseongicola sp. SB0675_bin_26]